MHKLSDLILRRQQLDRHAEFFNGLPEKTELEYTVEELQIQLAQSQKIIDEYHLLLNQGKSVSAELQLSIGTEIASYVEKKFPLSQQQSLFNEANLFDERLTVDQDLELEITNRISKYSSWKYPGLQLYPRSSKWSDLLVSSDPLYLAQYHVETIKDIIKVYPDLYQKRLRLYKVTNSQDLRLLPQNQFSIVFAWEFFNYLSIDIIENYMKIVLDLLRPGGAFIFSYNNCDLARSADWAECHGESYCTGTDLKNICDQLGYEISFLKDEPLNENGKHISWAEIKKPGKLSTTRAQPSLGVIKSK